MKALSRLIAMEKIGERNVLKHYFAVGALVPEVQRDSIIDGVCSVMTHLDGADRDAVWRDIEKRINKP